VLWAAAPVLNLGQASKLQRKPLLTTDLLGVVYVQVPAGARLAGEPSWWSALGPQLGVGLGVLAGAVPVGIVFGLLSTRRLTGRLRRLAATTIAVAQGDYRQRVAETAGPAVMGWRTGRAAG
jgi:two-component system, NarL family, sensor histidine kinase LiaS